MSAALALCYTQVVTVHASIRCVAVLDSCVISRMKATEFMVGWGRKRIHAAMGISKMDAVFR